MTVTDLAKKSKIPRDNISRMINKLNPNRIQESSKKKIAHATGYEIHDIWVDGYTARQKLEELGILEPRRTYGQSA